MPAIVAKEGTATWLSVLTWLPGQLLDPPLTVLHATVLNLSHQTWPILIA